MARAVSAYFSNRMKPFITAVILLLHFTLSAQTSTFIAIDAGTDEGIIEPLWGDHYEMHLLFGQGGNPLFAGPHQPFITDPHFQPEMNLLNPRYIRVSSGRFENPADTGYFSTSALTLKNLWTEFYKGGNSISAANDLGNYDFSYVDSLADVVHSVGAEPFFDLAYMPFTLSKDTTPSYLAGVPFTHLYSWDNSIRNSPPDDVQVYSRVMYQLIKHLNQIKGVTYFELWNEPDQFPLNTFFWKGTSQELYNMYEGVVAEIQSDILLSNNIKIGCCGFALNSVLNLFPISFLTQVQNHNTRMDFISFHPYSGGALGGYDSTRVKLVAQWKDTYVPDAALINSEWGILNSSFGSAGWSDLDYGIDRVKAIFDMNERQIKMAHQASLADIDKTSPTCCLGMYYVDTIFSPKPSAYVYRNLNKFLPANIRLKSSVNPGNGFVMAGKSVSGDTIVVAFPADNPMNGADTVSITISNLPWTAGKAIRYELTESSFANQITFNKTDSVNINGNVFQDFHFYPSDQNSGRLIIWELIRNSTSSVEPTGIVETIKIFPNPAEGHVYLSAEKLPPHSMLRITDLSGRLIYQRELEEKNELLRIAIEQNGMFFFSIKSGDKIWRGKIINRH
jgi:hypothetical protein